MVADTVTIVAIKGVPAMDDIVSRIEAEIAKRESAVEAMKSEIGRLREAAKILSVSGRQQSLPIAAHGDLNRGNELTQPAMAEQVLKEFGSPMHVAVILRRVNEKFKRDIAPNSLTTILFKYSQKGNTFWKVENAKNTYGLLEWKDRQSSATQEITNKEFHA
jgi:hypothetical protein